MIVGIETVGHEECLTSAEVSRRQGEDQDKIRGGRNGGYSGRRCIRVTSTLWFPGRAGLPLWLWTLYLFCRD
jgi:hypothetical protein